MQNQCRRFLVSLMMGQLIWKERMMKATYYKPLNNLDYYISLSVHLLIPHERIPSSLMYLSLSYCNKAGRRGISVSRPHYAPTGQPKSVQFLHLWGWVAKITLAIGLVLWLKLSEIDVHFCVLFVYNSFHFYDSWIMVVTAFGSQIW